MLMWLLWGRVDPGAWRSRGPVFKLLSLGEFIFPAAEAGICSERGTDTADGG